MQDGLDVKVVAVVREAAVALENGMALCIGRLVVGITTRLLVHELRIFRYTCQRHLILILGQSIVIRLPLILFVFDNFAGL